MKTVLQDSTPKCRGEFKIEVRRKGKIIDEWADHNLVVNCGRCRLAELAAGFSTNSITQIGLGSGSDAEAEEDTELQDQQLFPLENISVDGRDAKFEFKIGESQANGLSIREFVLFTSDDVMFSHRVRRDSNSGKVGVIDKFPDIEIVGYWLLHF